MPCSPDIGLQRLGEGWTRNRPDRVGRTAKERRTWLHGTWTCSVNDPEQERKATEYIHQHRTWFIALGAALIVLGVIAAGSSVATTYVSMIFLAGVLVVGGIIRFVSAFNAREWTGSLLLRALGCALCRGGRLDLSAPGCRRARLDASVRSSVPWCRTLPHHHVDLVPLSPTGDGLPSVAPSPSSSG